VGGGEQQQDRWLLLFVWDGSSSSLYSAALRSEYWLSGLHHVRIHCIQGSFKEYVDWHA